MPIDFYEYSIIMKKSCFVGYVKINPYMNSAP